MEMEAKVTIKISQEDNLNNHTQVVTTDTKAVATRRIEDHKVEFRTNSEIKLDRDKIAIWDQVDKEDFREIITWLVATKAKIKCNLEIMIDRKC
jgi:hypothetical protein